MKEKDGIRRNAMEYKTPYFTTDMIKDYTILLPNMAVTQFSLVKAVFQSEGYHAYSDNHNHTQNSNNLFHNNSPLKYINFSCLSIP